MRIIGILLLALSSAAHAEWAVDIHGLSKHFDKLEDFEERNPGIGIAYGSKTRTVIAGAFVNSLGDETAYVGTEITTPGYIRAGFSAGISYGYAMRHTTYVNGKVVKQTFDDPGFMPFAAPIVLVGRTLSIRVLAAPDTGYSPAFVALSLRYRL